MKKTILLLALLFSITFSFAQSTAIAKKTASAMLKARESRDYNTYASYLYPAEIKYRGGKEKFIKQLKSSYEEAKSIGVISTKRTLGEVSKIFEAGKELHCIIELTTKIKTTLSNMTGRSSLLAISDDKGKTWKFIITDGKIPSQVKSMVPVFNKGLMWPADTFESDN